MYAEVLHTDFDETVWLPRCTRPNIRSKYVEIFGARRKKHDKCTFEDHIRGMYEINFHSLQDKRV